MTHASRIFLAGDRAYKLKRPVSFPFMDFSTLEKREAAVRHELTLNRRTAPNLYLGAAAVRRGPDGLFIDESGTPAGDVIDWLVVMRRFEQDALLSAYADRKELDDGHVDALRDAIVSFHAESSQLQLDWPAAMKWVVEDNVDELEAYIDVFDDRDMLRHANEVMPQILNDEHTLLGSRVRAGRIRPCHGDLHLGNVAFLEGRATLFDALEFNPALANIDTLYDSAFMLMDLMARSYATQSFRLFNGLLDRNKDESGLALLPLYLATRAIVRAKVSAALAQREDDTTARTVANRYLSIARSCLLQEPPRILAIGGLSGTGKSTVARQIGPELGARPGARWLRSDVLRKLQHGVGELDRLPNSAYGPGTSAPVYDEMLSRARTAVDGGYSVVFDAVFASAKERDRVEGLAEELGVDFHGFWLEAPVDLRRKRVAGRSGDASDADGRVVELQENADIGQVRWTSVKAGDDAADTIRGLLSQAVGPDDRS
ncbi:MAG: AAA family ATPase [Myxococcota bacterium]